MKEFIEENYYYVSDRNLCIAVAKQIRNLLRKYTSDKDAANTIINRLNDILYSCKDEKFSEYMRAGLQPNKKIK
tara:strand:+ start:82 stop:303 length:222 start_codon:yes stop_codon:yes gene_type:complete